jgi:D-tyrosyl-tRNA(Tyr) deacylase
MRALIQRVSRAAVRVRDEVSGRIGQGLLVLAGFEAGETEEDLRWVAQKIVRLRVFPDDEGVMNRSVQDVGGELLAISQFTLFAATRKGTRPSWGRAAPPEIARPLFERFVAMLGEELGRPVPTGVFGADMAVELCNDGPVTLMLDSRTRE